MYKIFLNIKYPVILVLIFGFSAVDSQASPDMEIISLDIDKFDYYPDEDIRVECVVQNTGDEDALDVIVTLYASSDTTITSGDHYLGSNTDRCAPPGETSCIFIIGSIQRGDLPQGEYYIGVIITCSGDTNPANDVDYISTPITYDGSDLVVESIELSNFSHSEPDEVWIDYSIRNNGVWDSSNYAVRFYASSDSTITTDDYRLEGVMHSGLPAGEVESGGYRLQFVRIPRGDYYVGIIIICRSDIDEANNSGCSSETLSIIPSPDIIVRNVDAVSGIYNPGDSVDVQNVMLENIGYGPAESYTIDCYASTDDSIGSNDYHIGSSTGGPLEVDGSNSHDISCTFPDDIPDGDYYIGVIITCPDDIDLGNNRGVDSSDLVWVGQLPDIAVQSIGITPGVYLLGEELVIYSLMKNVGEGTAESYMVDYYASTDAVITTDDYHIGNVNRDELAPGEQHSYDTTYQVPFDIAEGNYYIGAIVTCPKEYELGNNTGCSEETIELVRPAGYDLVFQSIEVTPGEYSLGDELVIYNLIKNGGDSSTEGYAVDYYASIDTIITTADYHIGYVEREGLAPGQQHSYETTCLIPSNLIMGNYYIGAIIMCPIGSGMVTNTGCSEETFELVISGGDVSGQMLYLTRDYGKVFPIRYALVEVYDADDNEDPNDDRVIGRTHTNQDGNYAVVVLSDEMSSQNIYVKVFAETPIGAYPEAEGKVCSVRDDVFDEIYYMKSDLYPHPGDESVEVNMTADKKSGEFMVYDSIIESFEKAKIFFGLKLPEVTTFWPAEEETSYFDPCDLSMHIAQDDRGDRDVIMHEYGHYIADVFAFAQGDVGDNSIHYWIGDLRNYPIQRNDEQARNLAFRESWATLFSIATQYGDTSYPYSGDTRYQDQDEESDSEFKIDLEKDTDKKREPGEFYEHMNCCALWDIFDDNDDKVDDDDTLSDPNLSKIWTVLLASDPNDMIDFWNGWFACYDDYTSEITRIFQDHRMLFVKPNIPVLIPSDQNYRPIADAGRDRIYLQTCARGGYVHLDGYGSYDPEGDKLTYEWRLDGNRIATGRHASVYILPGTVTITLAVTDGQDYGYDTVTITVIPTDPSTWEE